MRVVARWVRLVEAVGSQKRFRSTYRYRLLAVASVVLVAGGLWLIGGNGPQLGNALLGLGCLLAAGHTVQWAAARGEKGKDPANMLSLFIFCLYGALLSLFWALAFAGVFDIGVIFDSSLGWLAFWLVVITPMVALLVLCIALSRRSKRTS